MLIVAPRHLNFDETHFFISGKHFDCARTLIAAPRHLNFDQPTNREKSPTTTCGSGHGFIY